MTLPPETPVTLSATLEVYDRRTGAMTSPEGLYRVRFEAEGRTVWASVPGEAIRPEPAQ